MEDRLDLLLRERVRIAADDVAASAPGSADLPALLRTGMRQRRLHLASLAAALTAVVALVAVVGLRLSPDATRAPGFYNEPPASQGPDPGASGAPGPGASDGPGPGEPTPRDSGSVAALPTPDGRTPGCVPAPAIQAPAGVEVALTLDETIYARDADIRLTLTVQNRSARAVEYRQDTRRYDFWIVRDDGVIWTWGHNRVVGYAHFERRLEPGEQISVQGSWDRTMCASGGQGIGPGPTGVDRPPPGRYVARALWSTSAGGWWSNPVEFVVL